MRLRLQSDRRSQTSFERPVNRSWSLRVLRHGNEGISGPNDDRLRKVHPAAAAHGCRPQQYQPFAGFSVDLEHRDSATSLNAIEMEAGNDPVVAEAEGELRFMVKRDQDAFFLSRTIANFSCRVIALIAASRFKAELWSG